MQKLSATVVSVHVGSSDKHGKEERESIDVELDGIAGDCHQSYRRECYAGDKQAKGTLRRNERQWSATSVEELQQISEAMNLERPITASEIGANLCFEGVSELSRLPMGTTFKFPSGAELMVSEFAAPCLGKGTQIAAAHRSKTGETLANTDFPKAAKLTRGLVGVVEVAGTIYPGDTVEISVYQHPSWLVGAATGRDPNL